MSIEQRIEKLEGEIALLERAAEVNQAIQQTLTKQSPPPGDLAEARGFLRSARDLLKHEEEDVAEELIRQARESAQPLRQWLAAGDLSISPFALRSYLGRNKLNDSVQLALIGYLLSKNPHAHNDRDKLDFLLSTYFAVERNGEVGPRHADPDELDNQVSSLFPAQPAHGLAPPTEIMLHELESLMAHIPEFTDFDQLTNARIVERARTLKISLGDDFYHQRVLPQLIRFNIAFRKQFETLFHQQMEGVREATRKRIEAAWNLIQAIEQAHQGSGMPEVEPVEIDSNEELETESSLASDTVVQDAGQRVALSRLSQTAENTQEEQELKGIIERIAQFSAQLSPEDTPVESATFTLRHTQLELARWGWEAFRTDPESAPPSIRTIRSGLGIVAWAEEELALYRQKQKDRYLSKPHFDRLSYAVALSVDVLASIRDQLRDEASAAEAAWVNPLVQLSSKMATTLNLLAPVFSKPTTI